MLELTDSATPSSLRTQEGAGAVKNKGLSGPRCQLFVFQCQSTQCEAHSTLQHSRHAVKLSSRVEQNIVNRSEARLEESGGQ